MNSVTGRGEKRILVGITGHRALEQVEQLTDRIDTVLDQIERTWPGACLTALSPLAEGSDRLVARRVLARTNAQLVVPLPMPEEEYLHDFAAPRSQEEFRELLAQAHLIIHFPPASSRAAAYETAGHYIIEHCHVLVALWNGEPPQGDGGTGAVVGLARARQRPLAWIYANNHLRTCASRLITAQGKIVYENFSLQAR